MWPEMTPNQPLRYGFLGSNPSQPYQYGMSGSMPSLRDFSSIGSPQTYNLPAAPTVGSQQNLATAAIDATVGGGSTGSSNTPNVATPETTEPQGLWGKLGGLDGLSTILKGLGSIGGVMAAFKGLDLAKDQFKFQKEAYNTNLANQTQSYNTALEDTIRARYQGAGRPVREAEAYLAKHSL